MNKALLFCHILLYREVDDMSKYAYPAVFTQEKEGYSITFPDFEACFTQGDDIDDGLTMAEDVLCLTLYDMEEKGEEIPAPSDPRTIKADEASFVTLVRCDTLEYRKFFDSRAVKKTLTVPHWLDEMAVKKNINFSQTLQNALMEQLGVKK